MAILLSAAALTGPASAFAQGSSGAGDNQYQDPFGGSSSPAKHSSSSKKSTATTSQSGGLSQNPNLGTSSTTPAPATATTTTTGQLPNTGSDPRLIVLAGLALLLFGIGLRLRTADERF
jgi:LPXTG-motif cell wall-anchored protein